MTDCGAVHQWIENNHFTTKQEVVKYVQEVEARTKQPQEGAFWDCLEEYDFEGEFILVHFRKLGIVGLRRRNRTSKQFMATNLDPAARASIRSFLESGRYRYLRGM
jgi:hypothetical protein